MATKKKPETKQPKPKTKQVSKSAKTGKMVSKEFAKANPDTTYETTVAAKGGKAWAPATGEKFLLGEKLVSVDDNGVVSEHFIRGGCQVEEVLGNADISAAKQIDQDEAFRMLAG